MKKNIFLLFAIMLLSITLTMNNALAIFSYYNISMPASYSNDTGKQFLQHSSGKGIYAYYDITGSQLVITEISSTGSLLSSQNVNIFGSLTGYAPSTVNSVHLSINALNSTFVSITLGCALVKSVTYYQVVSYIVLYNVNSYNAYFYSIQADYQTSYTQPFLTSPVNYIGSYGTNLIWYCYQTYTRNGKYSFILTSFNIVTHTATAYLTAFTPYSTDILPAPIFSIQNPNSTAIVYLLMSRADSDANLGKFYYLDLGSPSTAPAIIATSGSNQYFDNDLRMNFIGGGFASNGGTSPTAYIYIYWDIVAPKIVGTSKRLVTSQIILCFNNTISVANFLNQYARTVILYPQILTGSTKTWNTGFVHNSTTFRVNFPAYISSLYYTYYSLLTVSGDWFTSTTLTNSGFTYDGGILPCYNDASIIGYNSNWNMISEFETNTAHLYYGITPLGGSFAVTLVFNPSDNPLLQSKPYRITMSVTLNGLAYACNFIYYQNGVERSSGQTDINGQFYFSSQIFSQTGLNNITVKIYQGTNYAYQQTFSYFVQTTTIGSDNINDVAAQNMINLINTMPSVFMLILPPLILSFYTGILGFISGIVIMTIICASIGVIPIYFVYLMAFLVSAMVIYIIKS